MVGYYGAALKEEEWLLKEIENVFEAWQDEGTDYVVCHSFNSMAYEIIAKMKEGGWVSPADLKEALSRELAAGFRLGKNKSKGSGV